MTLLHLLVIEATQHRPDSVFTGLLEPLTVQVLDVAADNGWKPERLAIGDVTPEEISAAYDRADAIVVMGGDDVDPQFYGASSDYEGAGHFVTLADERTLAMIRKSATERIPLLGICRGEQLLNVAHGGTLVQHLELADDHRYAPELDRDAEFIKHPVTIEPGSELFQLFGPELTAVESSHHQAVDRLAPGMRASAFAPDGTIEAIEHTSVPQFAVQWHPEAESSLPDQLPTLLGALRAAVTTVAVPTTMN
ncbi:gamma-glutamyl-gamma-aminobutyrate hydrolase family protein [Gulosibacter macacae]|uniref:Gamma-glutamyl-gamma-aminobutyrate hydrolase family protein n=1 Tax=Gulosibacter macacae TaxID=2488791 RepID=A0A3P3W1M2_9MICO|nr:gamma-glutamyl-gamma-aminobutyrate hydrolase family protein [Gulosibacter macacae]RRJ88684.1 gamma-glutamyl-gamma-aminobutyrate hydrolase family protein [Gulosibacter macacae]